MMKLFKNIIYVSEPSVAQEASLARAISLAENNQSSLTVIDVVPVFTAGIGMPPGGPISKELQERIVAERTAKLDVLLGPYKSRPNIRAEVVIGKMSIEAIRRVLRNNHDLLIKPAENPLYIERLFGSEDMQLLRNCPCPVWLMSPVETTNYTTILGAVDFDPDTSGAENISINKQITDLSCSLALSDFAELHFVHVWDAPGESMITSWANNPIEAGRAYVEGFRSAHESRLLQFREQVKNDIGVDAYGHISPQFHLRRGIASLVIPTMARELKANLVVMGTVARVGIAGMLIGNTAEEILEQVQCSVLAVKPAGFVSPVTLPR